jgi:hypothetical protein
MSHGTFVGSLQGNLIKFELVAAFLMKIVENGQKPFPP